MVGQRETLMKTVMTTTSSPSPTCPATGTRSTSDPFRPQDPVLASASSTASIRASLISTVIACTCGAGRGLPVADLNFRGLVKIGDVITVVAEVQN